MDLLIIGGTRFLGRHLVEAAQRRGYGVTLFNRGQSNPGLFPEVEQLRGDRAKDLALLAGRRWDAVIDTCGYRPGDVRASARALAGAVGHYSFISTISVYEDLSAPDVDEDSPVGWLSGGETVEEVTAEVYGPLKVRCEQAVQEVFPGRALILRPGLIVGPHDSSLRFAYWPLRISRGGEVLAPGPPERRVQLIDARDLAEWNLDLIEDMRAGVFNVTGPDRPVAMAALLDLCRQVGGGEATLTWVDEAFLVEQGVGPYVEMPLWIPGQDDTVRIDRALQLGLPLRPLEETVADTLAWSLTLPPDAPRRAGLAPEREAELLALWREQPSPRGARPG
jgi:2'-hydroxyisoflavone reductase